jgi:hypothetical protein
MQGHSALFGIGFACMALTGCAPYKIQNSDLDFTKNNHSMYHIIPRHRCQMAWYDAGHWAAWAFFGNDDDGIFGEDSAVPFCSEKPNGCAKALRWWLRNPLHNFCFYVIGSAHRMNGEFTIIQWGPGNRYCLFWYEPQGETVFAGSGTSFYLGFHGWKPFVSLRIAYSRKLRSDFYIGWRPRGNFGIKLNFLKISP